MAWNKETDSKYPEESILFRSLSDEEEIEFRLDAREKKEDACEKNLYHPVVNDEWRKMGLPYRP